MIVEYPISDGLIRDGHADVYRMGMTEVDHVSRFPGAAGYPLRRDDHERIPSGFNAAGNDAGMTLAAAFFYRLGNDVVGSWLASQL